MFYFYQVSFIQYAKPSAVKKDINELFKEKHPNVTITLSKLRSLKAEILEISQKVGDYVFMIIKHDFIYTIALLYVVYRIFLSLRY